MTEQVLNMNEKLADKYVQQTKLLLDVLENPSKYPVDVVNFVTVLLKVVNE